MQLSACEYCLLWSCGQYGSQLLYNEPLTQLATTHTSYVDAQMRLMHWLGSCSVWRLTAEGLTYGSACVCVCVHLQVREEDCLSQLSVPKGCGPGGTKCVVTLSWEVLSEGKELELGITADLSVAGGAASHGTWAAVGFSPNGMMVNTHETPLVLLIFAAS